MHNKIIVVLLAVLGLLRIGYSADAGKTFQNPILSGFYPTPAFAVSVMIIIWSTALLSFSPVFRFFTAETWCIGSKLDTA